MAIHTIILKSLGPSLLCNSNIQIQLIARAHFSLCAFLVSLASIPAPLIDLRAAEIKALGEGCDSRCRPIVLGHVLVLKYGDLLLS